MTILKRIKRGAYKFNPPEVWESISAEAKDLVKGMLVVDAETRYSAQDVCNHPWISGDFKSRKTGVPNHLTSEQMVSLRAFHARNRVQKVVLKLRAQQLSDASVQELRQVFRKLDKQGTGEVPIADVRDKIRRIPALNEYIEEIMRVLWSQEAGNGRVNFDRFLQAMVLRHQAVQKEACRAIFEVFDFDGSGKITRDELKVAMGLGTETDTFKGSVEAVFGMSASDIKTKFSLESLTKEEYTFEEFFDFMAEQIRMDPKTVGAETKVQL